MLVKEVMTKRAVTIDCNKTVLDACEFYRDYRIGCLIVLENENCVGIVTERDFIDNIKKLPVIKKDGIIGIITVTDISKARPDLSKRFMESWVKTRWRD